MKKQFAALVAVPLICMTVEAHARYNTYDTKAYNAMREMVKEVESLQVNYAAAAGTPEDSVIFYGGFYDGDNDFIFTQINSNFEPDCQGVYNEKYFVSAPVKPGSCYMLEYWYWINGQYFSLNDFMPQTSPVIVQVPEEPGLYYFGCYAGDVSLNEGEATAWDKKPSAEMKPRALEKALSCYRGTAWEPLIRKELAQAQAEASQHKEDRRANEKEAKAKKRGSGRSKKENRK